MNAPRWRGGWWSGARRRSSPNWGARPAGVAVELIVVHSISLPPGEYGSDSIERLFTNRLDWNAHPYFSQIRGLQVSSHFLVRRGGECMQFVDCNRRAWHAGRSSWRGRDNCNDFSIGIELEGVDSAPYEDAQYTTLAALVVALLDAYPGLRPEAIVGHCDIAPDRKTDPGPAFEWPRLHTLVRRGLEAPPGSLSA